MANLTASQIAAQTAMHVRQQQQNARKRSQTIPDPSASTSPPGRLHQTSPPPVPPLPGGHQHSAVMHYQNGVIGGHRVAATTAANAAFPRTPPFAGATDPGQGSAAERETKPAKEKSKMKLFSKPKSIGISKDKELDKRLPALPSPNKMPFYGAGMLPRAANSSSISLVDPNTSTPSLYSTANASTSTLVPTERQIAAEKEREKHKHHFLSRQKHRLKDKDDHYNLPLSSASSNSKPTAPYGPQPLYSFAAPSSPGHSSTFSKSVSGLDLRHGGRALREKKKEERAASALAPAMATPSTLLDPAYRDRDHGSTLDRAERPGTSGLGSTSTSAPNALHFSNPTDHLISQAGLAGLGSSFGLSGLAPDDAWPLLKARLLNIFEGEDPRPPIEDFNGLVSVHIRRCIQKRAPTILIEDLRELLQTGFKSIDQTLRHVPDERLVPHLVQVWTVVFGTILPLLQAVFLPLDLEFRGRGQIMSAREAAEFWGAALQESDIPTNSSKAAVLLLGSEELDVRRITLLTFRDTVILPRNDALTAIFSRLSLENINAGVGLFPSAPADFASGATAHPAYFRPGTAPSSTIDPAIASFNSTSSTLLDSAGSGASLGARSRATSNTSAGSFHSVQSATAGPQAVPPSHPPPPPPQPMDSAQVTEMVGRLLQCVSVVASVQSADESQAKMERLTKELKYNWLGRGRTGRQRRGFVGPKVPRNGSVSVGGPR